MYLHEDGCICPKPQFGKHKQIKTESQENNEKGEKQSSSFITLITLLIFQM